MTVLDTSVVINRVKNKESIPEDATVITAIEYPPLSDYSKFTGDILYPSHVDYEVATELQKALRKRGATKGAQDLIIAAICINRRETLNTLDSDFDDITKVSSLQLI